MDQIKYTHRRDTRETPLNIDLNINNERQDCKIGTVGGSTGGVNEGERIWLMDFIHLFEIEQ
jgi:hypothetical protein